MLINCQFDAAKVYKKDNFAFIKLESIKLKYALIMHFKMHFRDTLNWKIFEIELFIILLLFETSNFFGSFVEIKMHQLS